MATLNEKNSTATATEEVVCGPAEAVSVDRKSAEIELIDEIRITQSEPHRADSVSDKSSVTSTTNSEPTGHADHINIDNPLAILSSEQLNQKLNEFLAIASDLRGSLTLLRQGAELVRDKDDALDTDRDLSQEQKDYLKDPNEPSVFEPLRLREKSSGLNGQSKFLKGSILSACLAGIVQGWTQSVINGANIGMPIDFGLHHTPGDPLRNTRDRWLFSTLTAIPFLAGGLIVTFFSDPLQDYWFGRRGAIAFACAISIAATVGQAFSDNVGQLTGCRLLTGVTLAAKASAAPLLVAEIAPNHLRGKLLSAWQLSDALGIFLGFASNLAVLNMKAEPNVIWRIQTITVLIPTTALLTVIYLMPESPRYLMKRGKYAKALESFTFLRPAPVSSLLAARDLVYAHFQLEAEHQFMEAERIHRGKAKTSNEDASTSNEKVTTSNDRATTGNDRATTSNNVATASNDISTRLQLSTIIETEPPSDNTKWTASYHIAKTKPHQRFAQTFRDPRSRRALVCASTAMIAQQLTGINTIAFLSATLLSDRGATDRQGAWVGFGIGLCNFIFGYPAWRYFDRIGRATLLLLGFPPMFILFLITALVFRISNYEVRIPLVSIFGILYIMAYSSTAGPAPFAISAEVFPLVIREVGHSLAVGVNFVSLGFVLIIFPSMSDAMGGYTASLALFAALNIVAFILCFLFVPETKERSIEELQYTFDLPTRKHIEYRCHVVTPWLLKTYLGPTAVKLGLWNKEKLDRVGDLPPFHRWGRNA